MTTTLSIDRANQESVDWRNLQPHLREGIDSMSDYRINSAMGLLVATASFQDQDTPNPAPRELVNAHNLAFGSVLKEAGQFRQPGQTSGIDSDPLRIETEMNLLHAQMGEMLKSANTDHQKLCAISFFQARLHAINPFQHGGPALANALLATQVEKTFGMSGKPILDEIAGNKDGYRSVLHTASRSNDLAPLASFIANGLGIVPPDELEIESAYAIKPRPMRAIGDIKSTKDELEMSKTGAPMPLSPSRDLDGPSYS